MTAPMSDEQHGTATRMKSQRLTSSQAGVPLPAMLHRAGTLG